MLPASHTIVFIYWPPEATVAGCLFIYDKQNENERQGIILLCVAAVDEMNECPFDYCLSQINSDPKTSKIDTVTDRQSVRNMLPI